MERVWHQKGAVPTRFLLLPFSLAMLDAHAIGQRDIADEKIERPRAAASMAERTFCVAATKGPRRTSNLSSAVHVSWC